MLSVFLWNSKRLQSFETSQFLITNFSKYSIVGTQDCRSIYCDRILIRDVSFRRIHFLIKSWRRRRRTATSCQYLIRHFFFDDFIKSVCSKHEILKAEILNYQSSYKQDLSLRVQILKCSILKTRITQTPFFPFKRNLDFNCRIAKKNYYPL